MGKVSYNRKLVKEAIKLNAVLVILSGAIINQSSKKPSLMLTAFQYANLKYIDQPFSTGFQLTQIGMYIYGWKKFGFLKYSSLVITCNFTSLLIMGNKHDNS